jgi:hypothetical protein
MREYVCSTLSLVCFLSAYGNLSADPLYSPCPFLRSATGVLSARNPRRRRQRTSSAKNLSFPPSVPTSLPRHPYRSQDLSRSVFSLPSTDRVLLVFLLHDLFFAWPACHDVSETLFMIFSLLSRVLEPRWAASAWSRLKRSDRDNLKQDGAVQGIEYLSAVGYPSTAICCSQPSVQRAASQLAGFHTKTGLKEVRNISKIESRDRFS